jgi:hypothetical protein
MTTFKPQPNLPLAIPHSSTITQMIFIATIKLSQRLKAIRRILNKCASAKLCLIILIYSCIVFPFIIWFYGSTIVIIRGWSCGFCNRREDIVA